MIIKSLMDKFFSNEDLSKDDNLDDILTFNKEQISKKKKNPNPIYDEISSKSERMYKEKYQEMSRKDERKRAYEDSMNAKNKLFYDNLKEDEN